MSYRIMVVDDEARIADTLALVLQHSGYETAVAYEGDSALAQCPEFQPDLLLTDVVMPGMDGIELSQHVTDKFPTCKVLLFSGNTTTTELLERAQKKGRNLPLLSKPVHPVELLRKIAETLNSFEMQQDA
ncbi:MAG: response regulator [Acidobacteriaceae bacterium]